MAARTQWWRLLPSWLRRLPADLAAVLILTVLTNAVVVLPVIRDTPLRVVFGLPFVLFLPGYAFIAALFPEAGESPTDNELPEPDNGDSTEDESDRGQEPLAGQEERSGIDGIERVALAFGLSIAIVPLIGLVLNFTPWGIRLIPILLSVSGFTLVSVGIAAQRRWALPPEEQFQVPFKDWLAAGRSELFEPESRTDAALNVLLAFSVILALGSVGYAIAVPQQGESFTEFYLLTETDDGDLVADNYPTEYTVGESKSLVIGIGNQEHETVRYQVVTQLERVRIANNSTTVLERQQLDQYPVRLAHNETDHTTYNVTPTMEGDRLRLAFLLYKDGVPENTSVDNAYRETHLWINISQTEAST